MNDKLRNYVEELFKDAPKTPQIVEFKEEILQNTIDRYNDLISEGKTEQAAFNIAVAGIGDIGSIIDTLDPAKKDTKAGLYGYTREEVDKNRKQSAAMLTAAIMLYILSPVPIIALNAVGASEIGVVLMFVMIAAATGLIIYRSASKLPVPESDETMVEDFKEWSRQKQDNKTADTICNVIWILLTVFYVLVSLHTGLWHITWLIFPIIIAICNVVHAVADLTKSKED